VLSALDSLVFLSVTCVCVWFPFLMLNPASQPVLLPPPPSQPPPHCDAVCIWRPYEWIPFGDHPLKLEGCPVPLLVFARTHVADMRRRTLCVPQVREVR